jgi:hypothetical protein
MASDVVNAAVSIACGIGLLGMSCSSPSVTINIDQCEEIDKALKEEYGDDYRTNRETMPLTSFGLQYIKSTGCTQQFDYENLVDEFCQSLDNYTEQIGGGETCESRDQTNILRSRWCLNEDGPNTTTSNGILIGDDAENRMKGDIRCNKEKLTTKYDETWVKFCKAKPADNDCTCYNIKNNVCDVHSDAAGCQYYTLLEEGKDAFSTKEERDALQEGEEPASYTILKTKGHCRPRTCDSGYIPPNVKSDCAATYPICGKDIDIRTHTNSQIAIKCNYDPDRANSLPDWWSDDGDYSFMENALKREPPFDKFPLNKLPITRFPKRFRWKDKNVRFLTYGGVGSVSSCCLCLLLIMSSLKRR